jgi:hypothetical protein
MSRSRSRDSRDSIDGIELEPYENSISAPAWNGRHDDDHINEDNEEERVLNEDPQQRRASVQSFELYTPDEEKRVIRKLDIYVVGFMSFLYLLSFIDSKNMTIYANPPKTGRC